MARLLERWSAAWRDVAVSTLAAALAWWAARAWLGHPRPVFVAIAVVVCLAPGLPSHGRQAVGLAGGVAVGIAVGEAAQLAPAGNNVAGLALATFAAVMLAAAFGLGAIMVIQAGASAVIVVAAGSAAVGLERVGDALVGAAVGLAFSQVLLTPDPVPGIDRAARRLLAAVAGGLSDAADALARRDPALGRRALERLVDAHRALLALEDALALANRIARWTVRGRLGRAVIAGSVARHDRRGAEFFGAALLFAGAVEDALAAGGEPPPGDLVARARAVAASCAAAAGDAGRPPPDGGPPGAAPGRWPRCASALDAFADALDAFDGERGTRRRDDRPGGRGGG